MSEIIERKAKIYILTLCAIFIILEISSGLKYKMGSWALSFLFILIGIAFELLKVRTERISHYDITLSAGVLTNLLAITFLNPFEATLVAFVSMGVSSLRKALKGSVRVYKYLFNISQIAITAIITALLTKLCARSIDWFVAYSIFAPIIYIILNATLVAIGVSLNGRGKFERVLKSMLISSLPSFLFLLPSMSIVLLLYRYSGFLFIPLTLLFLFLALLGNYYRKLYEEAKIENMMILVKSLEERDEYTYGHSQRVANISEKVAKKQGFKEAHIERIKIAAMLHDIGKIGIPDNILRKPGRLSETEFEEIKKHPVKGYEILKKIRRFQNHEAKWVKYHHERLDGSGYPEGLTGDQIPLESKIIAVADIYEALTSDRPYRKAMTKEQALKEMRKMAGNAIDGKVFKAFLEALEEEGDL